MTIRQEGSRARDLFAALRDETPGLAQAEEELGSRLVVARNVMRLRIQRGYTQKRLAEELGVRQPRVAEIESARANLQIDTLDRLAKVFGVEPATLLSLLDPEEARRRFFEEYNAGWATFKADREAWEEEQEERDLRGV